MKIPYLDLKTINQQHQEEIEGAAMRCIRSGFYLNSDEVSDFEEKWASYVDCKYCVSTANGLDALTAILIAMKAKYEWENNSEIIVSAHTFIASFEAITRAGLRPVPCDVSTEDYLINVSLIKDLIGDKTVAIMPVHLYGRICNINDIELVAQRHGLKIIADACQAHGMSKNTTLGDAAAFSFYPGKNLGALGDGGCLVTNDEQLADLARAYCNYGAKQKYRHDIKGINSRLDAIQAAILKVKMQYLDSQNSSRQEIARHYNYEINNPLIQLPYGGKEEELSNWHIYPVFTPYRDQLKSFLESYGINTIIHYPIPPHKQLAYSELNTLSLPVTEKICEQELSIPLNPVLTKEEQDYIIKAINSFSI